MTYARQQKMYFPLVHKVDQIVFVIRCHSFVIVDSTHCLICGSNVVGFYFIGHNQMRRILETVYTNSEINVSILWSFLTSMTAQASK